MPGLVSLRALERIIGVPRTELKRVAADFNASYHTWKRVDPKTGKERTICSPLPVLKEIQRRITRRLLRRFTLGDEVQGGVRGKSPRTNAKVHIGKRWVVTIDVRKFFPSVRHTCVFRMFRNELGYGHDVALLVTKLVIYKGQLPQGAPTSVTIANLLLKNAVDQVVLAEAQRLGISYTRFVDDLAFSGDSPRVFINLVARQLSKMGLAISRNAKLKIMPRSRPQLITGLLVNNVEPSIPRQKRDRVRAAIYQLGRDMPGPERVRAVRSARGRVVHVKQFNRGSAARLERQLLSVE